MKFTILSALLISGLVLGGTVNGRITDEVTGDAVIGATVAIEGTQLGAFTDSRGEFIVEGADDGEIRLFISSVGHINTQTCVTAGEFASIEMTPTVVGGTTIVVTGTGTPRFFMNSPVATSVVSRKTIEIRSEPDLYGILDMSTGVRVENNCQNCNFSQVRIHGLEGQYTQILIDGNPVVSSLAKVYGLQQFPAEMVEQVEVVKGGGSALYGGSAVAGVVNLITRKPEENQTVINLESGFVDGGSEQGLAFSSSAIDAGSNLSSVVYGRVRSRDEIDINNDHFSDVGRLRSESIGGNLFAGNQETGLLTVSAHYIHEKRRGGDQIDVPAHLVDVAEGTETWRYGGSVRWDGRFSESVDYSLNTSGAYTERDSFYGGLGGEDPSSPDYDPASGYGESENPVFSVQTRSNIQFGNSQLVSFGVQGSREKLEDRSFTLGSRTINEIYTDIGAFVQDDITVGSDDQYEFLLGARVDNHSAIEDIIISPRASLKWEVANAITLRGGVTTGFNAPQVFDEDLHIEVVGGSPRIIVNSDDLTEERSASYYVNFEYRTIASHTPVSLSLGGFRTSLTDAFALVEVGENEYGELVFKRLNEGGAHVQGLELEAGVILGSVSVLAGVTVQEALYDDNVEVFNEVFSDRIMRTPNVYGNLSFDWQALSNLDVFIGASYTGEMEVPHDCEHPVINTTEPMVTVDADASWDINGGFLDNSLALKVGVKNITDEYQEDLDQGFERDAGYVYGPAAPRLFTLGIEVGI